MRGFLSFMRTIVWCEIAFLFAMLLILFGAAISGAAAGITVNWMDPSDAVDVRVERLLSQMTIDEMQAQTIHLTGGEMKKVRFTTSHPVQTSVDAHRSPIA